ncbi:MAG: PEP/pyruvate-binding domain-containing protein [Dermatophilaceae bacterium]
MTDQSMSFVAIEAAQDERAYGGKAAQLAVASRAGLPVPAGVALSWRLVDAVADGDPEAMGLLEGAASTLGGFLAVRSSAVGEDSSAASFAGQHRSLLNVLADRVAAAVAEVRQSGHSAPARAYRQRLGVPETARIGVVIQDMVDADVAGVLFRPNPVTGADEIVIESAWGLGEAVANGLVTPDLFRLSLEGELLERRCGVKDVQVRPAPGGGTIARPAPPATAGAMSLDDRGLADLHRLATICTDVFGGSQDLEWALADRAVWLMQRRAVTAAAPRGV